jgi:hypothetical protein
LGIAKRPYIGKEEGDEEFIDDRYFEGAADWFDSRSILSTGIFSPSKSPSLFSVEGADRMPIMHKLFQFFCFLKSHLWGIVNSSGSIFSLFNFSKQTFYTAVFLILQQQSRKRIWPATIAVL